MWPITVLGNALKLEQGEDKLAKTELTAGVERKFCRWAPVANPQQCADTVRSRLHLQSFHSSGLTVQFDSPFRWAFFCSPNSLIR